MKVFLPIISFRVLHYSVLLPNHCCMIFPGGMGTNIFILERHQWDCSTRCGETMSLLGSLLGARMTQRQFRHQKVHPSMNDDPRFPSQLVGNFIQESFPLTSTPSNCFLQEQPAGRELGSLGTLRASWDLYVLRASQAPKCLPSASRRATLQCRANSFKSLHEGTRSISPGA